MGMGSKRAELGSAVTWRLSFVEAIWAARAASAGDFMASSNMAVGNAEIVVATRPRRTCEVEKGMVCDWRSWLGSRVQRLAV
jgi:hypothetical protein